MGLHTGYVVVVVVKDLACLVEIKGSLVEIKGAKRVANLDMKF